MKAINVRLPGRSYSIIIGRNLLPVLGNLLKPLRLGSKILIVSNRNVSDLFLGPVRNGLKRAGYEEVADQMDGDLVYQKLAEVECAAREMAHKARNTVTHNRGTEVIEAGNIRLGLEMRTVGPDGGPAIHVLGDVAGQEIELLAFDCFRENPHYHYGPRAKNERIFWDTTLVPDALRWTLDQFKTGKLPAMIDRAGYPTIAAALDADLIAAQLPAVEAKLKAMMQADPR